MIAKQAKDKLRVGRGMYAVTIQQPQAAAVLAQPGLCAHPSWKTDYRGPLLIHAAARGGQRESRRGGRGAGSADDADYGALLGVVDLVDCVAEGRVGGDPDEVGYFWVLANPRTFACPVPHGGRTGLFLVSDAALTGVHATLMPPAAPSRGMSSTKKAAAQPAPAPSPDSSGGGVRRKRHDAAPEWTRNDDERICEPITPSLRGRGVRTGRSLPTGQRRM